MNFEYQVEASFHQRNRDQSVQSAKSVDELFEANLSTELIHRLRRFHREKLRILNTCHERRGNTTGRESRSLKSHPHEVAGHFRSNLECAGLPPVFILFRAARRDKQSVCCCRQDLRPELVLVSSHLCNLRNLWMSLI